MTPARKLPCYYCKLAPVRLLARMLEASVALSLYSPLLAAWSVALLALPSYYCQLAPVRLLARILEASLTLSLYSLLLAAWSRCWRCRPTTITASLRM